MKKSLSLFLALRYLQPKRTFVSIITLISVLGVTLGITVLILVISVMSGFELELQKKVIGFDAHVTIQSGGILPNWQEVAKQVAEVPGVVGVAPYTMGRVMAEANHRWLAPIVRGIDPEKETHITDIGKYLIASSSNDAEGRPILDLDGEKCVVGADFASQLELSIGSKLNVTSPKSAQEVMEQIDRAQKEGNKDPQVFENIKSLVLPTTLTVTGIFESGRYVYDSDFVLVPLFIGQEMYELDPDSVHGLSVKTIDPFTSGITREAIMARIGPPNVARTWVENNKSIFEAIDMERGVMFIILMIIVVVAGFCIMNTLFTFTFMKTKEIGILKALGSKTSQIVSIFLFQGMAIGLMGSVTGLLTGLLLIQFRNETRDFLSYVLGIPVFSREVYQFSEIPAKVVPSDVAIICVSAFVICSLAALIPAYFAARLDPVKALRYE